MDEPMDIDPAEYSFHFIGYDDDHNGYWEGIRKEPGEGRKYSVIIFSKYGEVLDGFHYGRYDYSEANGLYSASNSLTVASG